MQIKTLSLVGSVLLAALPLASSHPHVPRADAGTTASPFPLSQVQLTTSRWSDNQNRTLSYLRSVDVERLLYVFRANHKLSTKGAAKNGGWDAPDFPFRSHMQGHFLTAWAQCYASTRDATCRSRAIYFAGELAKCQANNAAAGFARGYLSGFPESEITAVEQRRLTNGNVPWYAIHKTMAGLLDVWRMVDGDNTARDVLLAMAAWVDARTAKLSRDQMQSMLDTEFGGMNDVLADIYHQTGDKKHLTTAQRFDHEKVFAPLASNRDQLNGLHANTQVPKWIGAVREFKATGTQRYRDIAANAWSFTVDAHTYAIGGNSQAEHFRAPHAIAGYLSKDTAEGCNTYNMLKLTRELWTLDPTKNTYFDFYERALINHLLGQQNAQDPHGHITYFTPMNAGGRRGVGPAWGGGTWSTDYNSFWCCQGTGIETNTKLMDSIYFYDDDEGSLFVNLFTPSVLDYKQRGVTITQATGFPVSDTTTLTIGGGGGNSSSSSNGNGEEWTLRIRVPSWTTGVEITVNGEKVSGMAGGGGSTSSYASVRRAWKAGDKVVVRLPMKLRLLPANDKPGVAAVAYGPVILSGNYGDAAVSGTPGLVLDSLRRTSGDKLDFTGTAGGKQVKLGPFYDAHGFNYVVYWAVSGKLPS